jgi:putative ABC transport system permease protein
MTKLHTKLFRDLWRMRGQVVTIAAVVACGIASYVTLRSAYGSLLRARDVYYASQRFADVFAQAKRAPESVAARIESIPGVALVETRLVETVMVPMDDLPEPATGRLISIPSSHEPRLNAPLLRKGRMVEPGRPDEALVVETFANAHRLEPGASIPVVLNGVQRNVRVVGLAMSPEYVIGVGRSPGQEFAPDDRRFCVLWMDRDEVAPVFDLKGAFDDVSLLLQPGASPRGVIERLDALLKPYGGYGAVGRDRQPSSFFVDNELRQLKSYATIAPLISLSVAAFLVNVVLARVVQLQRPQLATLKALGYRGSEIALHYISLVLIIVTLGAAAGLGLGAWLGRGMLGLYSPYFHFASIQYRLDPSIMLTSIVISLGAAVVGGLAVVRRAARLPPAEAMQPEAPPAFHRSRFERMGLGRWLSGGAMMIERELVRRPLRTTLACTSIAFGISIIVVGAYTRDALDVIIDIQFEQSQREDMSVGFTRPLDASASTELSHLPGVLRSEGLHAVPVRLRHGPQFRDTVLTGLPPDGRLRSVVEWPRHAVDIPPEGVLLGDALAKVLDLNVGDLVTVEVLEGDRRTRDVRVSALAHEMFGLTAYMSLPSMSATLGSEDSVSTALLSIDSRFDEDIARRLKRMPHVASVTRRRDIIDRFRRQSVESMNTTSLVLTLFGCAIAAAVVYSTARIALSVRGRDLASLRVLGFTRREVSTMLLGELATYVALAIAPGLALGKGLAAIIISTVNQEFYRLPVVVTGRTYAFATAVTLCAALLSALVVRRQLDRLDLVAVLKARE